MLRGVFIAACLIPLCAAVPFDLDPEFDDALAEDESAGWVTQDSSEEFASYADDVSRDEDFVLDGESDACGATTPRRRCLIREAFPLFDADPSLAGFPAVAEIGPRYGLLLFVDYDAFRGFPDGDWENNGVRTGFNAATELGSFTELTGIALQIGASAGVYDWAGADYRMQHGNRQEFQGFLTYGLYRKPTENSGFVAGIVQDWMFNDAFSVFGQSPTMSQLRGQAGYAFSASNEFGVSGATHLLGATRNVPSFGPVQYQSVSQLSGYWHHKWYAGGADTWISIGVPAHSRLAGGGSLGDWLVSATALCPFSDAVSLFSSVTYMHQSATPGGSAGNDEAWNFTVGVSLYPGRNARTRTVAGQRWMPLLPVANNGSFLTDSSQNY